MLFALLLCAPFAHPSPQPAADLPSAVYKERRERVMKELGGCATALAAQGEAVGVVQEFKQDDDFFWLTGVSEPGAWLVLAPKAKYLRTILYLRPRDPGQSADLARMVHAHLHHSGARRIGDA